MTVLLMFAALCRESILGLLLCRRCVGIAGPTLFMDFLTRMDLFLAYMAYVSGSGKMAFFRFLFIS